MVLVGDGGVGKTTLSAALAYGSASAGKTVGVLTIDPAPRLGDALGLTSLDEEPKCVALPDGSAGSLWAMRLDSKRTLDRMVERYAASPKKAAALLQHPIYRAVSEQLAGAESYAAFQRLHELLEEGDRDCLVLDTPPAINATEMLAAPTRLTDLVGTGALSLLADPARIVARAGGAIARTTLSLVLAALERVTGTSLQRDVSDFVAMFDELVGGLEGRARGIDALLRDKSTAFVMVTRPRADDVERALEFRAGLAAMGIEVAAIVVNRVTPDVGRPIAPHVAEKTTAAAKGRKKKGAERPDETLRGAIEQMEADMNALRAVESNALAQLRKGLSGTTTTLFLLESRDVDIASLDDIAVLSRALGA